MTLSLGTICEETCGFKHHVNAKLLPRKLIGTQHATKNLDSVTVNNQVIAVNFNSTVKLALRGVILEQMGGGLNGGKVVDGNNLLELGLGHGAKHVATNATKTVNSVFSHKCEDVFFKLIRFPAKPPGIARQQEFNPDKPRSQYKFLSVLAKITSYLTILVFL